MDTLQLKLFLSLSRTLSFTRTASEFFMSQPTVSNQIRALEAELGTELLKRSSHHVSLTPAGREYLDYAARIVDMQAAAELRLRNLAADRPGYVRVAMLSSSAPYFSQALKAFSQKWPRVQVDVAMLEGGEMLKALSQQSYDLYFANESLLPRQREQFSWAVIHESPLHLFFHQSMEERIDLDNWEALGRYPFVSMPAADFALTAQIEQLCAARGIQPDIINYYNRADMLLLSVDAGVGLAILPQELAYMHCPEQVMSRPIEGEDALVRSILVWKNGSENPDAENFRLITLAGTERTT